MYLEKTLFDSLAYMPVFILCRFIGTAPISLDLGFAPLLDVPDNFF